MPSGSRWILSFFTGLLCLPSPASAEEPALVTVRLKPHGYQALVAAPPFPIVRQDPVRHRVTMLVPPQSGSIQRVKGLMGKASLTVEAPFQSITPPTGEIDLPDVRNKMRRKQAQWDAYRKASELINGKVDVKSRPPRMGFTDAYLYFASNRQVNGKFDPVAYQQNLERALAAQQGTVQSQAWIDWQQVGPNPVKPNQPTYMGPLPTSGRVNGIAPDPVDPNTLWIAKGAGGLFVTRNGGTSWSSVFSPLMVQHAGSAVAIDPKNRNRIFYGTGDFAGSVHNTGRLLVSDDGGTIWKLGTGLAARSISSIAIHPELTNIVLATADNGLYRSTNSGASWTRLRTGRFDRVQWSIKKTDGTRYAYAVQSRMKSGFVFRSSNNGANFTASISPTVASAPEGGSYGRMTMAVSALNPEVYYVVVTADRKVWKIDRSQTPITIQDVGSNVPSQSVDGVPNFNWSQAWYDLHLQAFKNGAVDELFLGLVDLVRSGNAVVGNGWGTVGYGYAENTRLHVDQHSMVADPHRPNQFYVGNDGGIFRLRYTSGRTSWTFSSLNNGLRTHLIYKMDVHPNLPHLLSFGTQDNGSISTLTSTGSAKSTYGGDGGGTAISATDPAHMIATAQYGSLTHTRNRWQDQQRKDMILNKAIDESPFVAPVAISPHKAYLSIYGGKHAYKSTNYGENHARSATIFCAKDGIQDIEFDPTTVGVVFMIAQDGRVWVSRNDGTSWREIFKSQGMTPTLGRGLSVVRGADGKAVLIAASDANGAPTVFYGVSFDNLTWTWLDVGQPMATRKLPSGVPVNDVAVHPDDPNLIYAATDLGVYRTLGEDFEWYPMTSLRFPAIVVNDLKVHTTSGYLLAGTFGRGIWRWPLPGLAFYPVAASLNSSNVKQGTSVVGSFVFNETIDRTITVTLTSSEFTGERSLTLAKDKITHPFSILTKSGQTVPTRSGWVTIAYGSKTLTRSFAVTQN